MRKKKETSIVLPGLYFDNEEWVKPSKYPNFQIFTDKVLAETLCVSPNTVKTWRVSNIIPHRYSGNFPAYELNSVIEALIKAGYKIDPTKKSKK